MLAVTGRRPDGYHDLVSVVAPLSLADELSLAWGGDRGACVVACDDPTVPDGEENLVAKAVRAYARRVELPAGTRWVLGKRVPSGAGLGGGSSDAAGALRLLQAWAEREGRELPNEALVAVGAEVGSDVPLFLRGGAVVIRGRGERVEPVSAEVGRRWEGRRVLVFKPWFGVSTPWAYGRLAAGAPASYSTVEAAEARVAALLTAEGSDEPAGENDFAAVVGGKYLALPAVWEALRERTGLRARLSGSGSACFLFPRSDEALAAAREVIVESLGGRAFVADCVLSTAKVAGL